MLCKESSFYRVFLSVAIYKQGCYNWSGLYFIEREEVCSPAPLLLPDSTWKGAATAGMVLCLAEVGRLLLGCLCAVSLLSAPGCKLLAITAIK